MFKKIKNRYSRQSFYSDQLIQNNASAQCGCELYIPFPSLDNIEGQGGVQWTGDVGQGPFSEGTGKHCTVYLCEVPVLESNFILTLEDTGQDAEICLSVVLNGFKKGEIILEQKGKKEYTFKQKVGGKWRTFVLRFYPDPSSECDNFQVQLEETLEKIVTEKHKHTYLLLAIAKKDQSTSAGSASDLNTEPSDTDPNCISISPIPSPTSTPQPDIAIDDVFISPPFQLAGDIPGLFARSVRKKSDSDEIELTRIDTDKQTLDVLEEKHDSTPSFPSETPQRLESLLRSIEREKQNNSCNSVPEEPPRPHVYMQCGNDTEYLNSEFLPTEELYMKMGTGTGTAAEVGTDKSVKSQKQLVIQRLAALLQAAINGHDVDTAQEHAKNLAAQNVSVTITAVLKTDEEQEFSLKVYVEDKESSGLSIQLMVRASDTIYDLKERMLIKNMFPVEVQRWIIGKRIPADTETLAQCKVRTDGNTAFLYLVSAKSVGINKEDFMKQHAVHEEPHLGYAIAPVVNIPVDQDPVRHTPAVRPKEPKIPDVNLNANINEPLKTPSKLGKSPQRPKSSQGSPNIALDGGFRQENRAANKIYEKHPMMLHETLAGNQMQMSSAGRQPVESEEVPDQARIPVYGWICTACTFINQPTRPGCEVCTNPRPPEYQVPDDFVISEEEKKRLDMEQLVEQQTKDQRSEGRNALCGQYETRSVQEEERQFAAQRQERQRNYLQLQQTDSQDIIPNQEEFTCPICFDDIRVGEGVVLRECLHHFCRECLRDSVIHTEEAMLKCPYQDDEYTCDSAITDREIRAVTTREQYEKFLSRSLLTAESQAANSFHCKTADCPGWCIYEDHVNFFVCPVCHKENCLTCKAIHQGMNCKQYQDDLKTRALNDRAANQTQIMIRKMLDEGDAMSCPKCKVIVMKKEGCDWIQCSICKTEICWVTKGPRWGPRGAGDTSGGCQCRVDGQACHPDCNNCH